MNTVGLLDNAWRDLKYGARVLRLNPGFAIVAILSLALGIGANAAIYSLFDEMLLQPLPVTHPERLVNFTGPGPQNGQNSCNSAGGCDDVRANAEKLAA